MVTQNKLAGKVKPIERSNLRVEVRFSGCEWSANERPPNKLAALRQLLNGLGTELDGGEDAAL
jgi:hypothetical protein